MSKKEGNIERFLSKYLYWISAIGELVGVMLTFIATLLIYFTYKSYNYALIKSLERKKK